MRKTEFYELHKEFGAKIIPFGGFEMPVQYKGIIEEHRAVRNSVGVFDVSHMGEFIIRGENAEKFLNTITINDVSKLTPNKIQYSALCYKTGGIVDDLLVYKIEENHFMLVVNASNIEKDFSWIESNLIEKVKLTNESDTISLLAIQGPNSLKTLQKLTEIDLSSMAYYTFATGKLTDVEMLISRTGYTGEIGFELYFDISKSEKIWRAVFDAGAEFNIQPIGLGARDTLRLEMGFCLYGNDIDQTTSPLEAGLGWITKLNKMDFIGKEFLDKQNEIGVERKLVGLKLNEKSVARHGYEIFSGEEKIGIITSGTFSPSLENGIALGYVATSKSQIDTNLEIDIRGKKVSATIVSLPFYRKG